jgi:hypothetical protein
MLEGLPSTGKTYNARFINIQLERNNINAEWIHEVAMPNPVIFFDEAGMTYDEYDRFIKAYPEAADILNSIAVFKKSTIGIHLPELEWNYMDKIGENAYQALLEYDVWKFPHNKYKAFALDKWAYFTEKAIKNHGNIYGKETKTSRIMRTNRPVLRVLSSSCGITRAWQINYTINFREISCPSKSLTGIGLAARIRCCHSWVSSAFQARIFFRETAYTKMMSWAMR